MKKFFLLLLFVSFSLGAQIITVKHTAYEIHLDTILKEPVYTHYILTPEMFVTQVHRTHFSFDPSVSHKYQGTGFGSFASKYGYDRGHLAPDADFRTNDLIEKEAMYYDNTAVQEKKFNETLWKYLEEHVRNLGKRHKVEVWTGCIYEGSTAKFHDLVVPTHYWKVIRYNGVTEAWKIPNVTPTTKDFNLYKVDPVELMKLTRTE